MVPARPFFIGRPGWLRSSAWIWLFSSTDSTSALAGGLRVKADDIDQLGGEVGVARQFEAFDPMRLQPVCLPDPLHRGGADAERLGQHARAPVCRRRRPLMEGHL